MEDLEGDSPISLMKSLARYFSKEMGRHGERKRQYRGPKTARKEPTAMPTYVMLYEHMKRAPGQGAPSGHSSLQRGMGTAPASIRAMTVAMVVPEITHPSMAGLRCRSLRFQGGGSYFRSCSWVRLGQGGPAQPETQRIVLPDVDPRRHIRIMLTTHLTAIVIRQWRYSGYCSAILSSSARSCRGHRDSIRTDEQ